LSRRDWAWEFLRRNPAFRELHATTSALSCKIGGNATAIEISSDQRAALLKWGCIYSDPPDCEATSARVLWDPVVCPEVIQMVAFEEDRAIDAPLFELSSIHCQVTVLATSDSSQYVLFREAAQSLQLLVTGASIERAVHLLSTAIVPPQADKFHFRGLQCFQHLQRTGHIIPDHCAVEPRSPRYAVVLKALDGYLAGESYRDIANALFGAQRVHSAWGDPGRHLHDQVRRAVRRGRDLMEGEYLKLLA
jgi:hypothetical protein